MHSPALHVATAAATLGMHAWQLLQFGRAVAGAPVISAISAVHVSNVRSARVISINILPWWGCASADFSPICPVAQCLRTGLRFDFGIAQHDAGKLSHGSQPDCLRSTDDDVESGGRTLLENVVFQAVDAHYSMGT